MYQSFDRRAAAEVGRMVVGVSVDETLARIDEYLRKHHALRTQEEIYAHWRSLSRDQKIELTRKALS
jgi:hypothetical protein